MCDYVVGRRGGVYPRGGVCLRGLGKDEYVCHRVTEGDHLDVMYRHIYYPRDQPYVAVFVCT